jgi:hypothetical protein
MPPWRKFILPRGGGEKNVFLVSACIRTSKGGRGLTSNFLCWGSYGCFWPIVSDATVALSGM